MDEPRVDHHKNCHANYPEKVPGERPQQLTRLDIGDGEDVLQCVDCGAFVVVPSLTESA